MLFGLLYRWYEIDISCPHGWIWRAWQKYPSESVVSCVARVLNSGKSKEYFRCPGKSWRHTSQNAWSVTDATLEFLHAHLSNSAFYEYLVVLIGNFKHPWHRRNSTILGLWRRPSSQSQSTNSGIHYCVALQVCPCGHHLYELIFRPSLVFAPVSTLLLRRCIRLALSWEIKLCELLCHKNSQVG